MSIVDAKLARDYYLSTGGSLKASQCCVVNPTNWAMSRDHRLRLQLLLEPAPHHHPLPLGFLEVADSSKVLPTNYPLSARPPQTEANRPADDSFSFALGSSTFLLVSKAYPVANPRLDY